MGKKRKMPGLNTSSTADISFMLLIFFLVTTSMDTDKGLGRTLPKPPEPDQQDVEIKVKERNILNIRINKSNEVAVGNDLLDSRSWSDICHEIKERAKEFIKNEQHSGNLPEVFQKNIEGFSHPMEVTENHVISVQTDVGTDYYAYFNVQDALVAAYNELREELAMKEFHHKYEVCTDAEKEAIKKVYPQKISEAEPKKYGGDK